MRIGERTKRETLWMCMDVWTCLIICVCVSACTTSGVCVIKALFDWHLWLKSTTANQKRLKVQDLSCQSIRLLVFDCEDVLHFLSWPCPRTIPVPEWLRFISLWRVVSGWFLWKYFFSLLFFLTPMMVMSCVYLQFWCVCICVYLAGSVTNAKSFPTSTTLRWPCRRRVGWRFHLSPWRLMDMCFLKLPFISDWLPATHSQVWHTHTHTHKHGPHILHAQNFFLCGRL